METPNSLINLTTRGEVDHTLVKAPYFRLTDVIDNVCVYDMRMLQPNEGSYSTTIMHSVEHCLAVALKAIIPASFVNCAPLGCRTGCYITTVNFDPQNMGIVLKKAIEYIVNHTSEVPLANKYQCGNCTDHSFIGAQIALCDFLSMSDKWGEVL